MSRIPHRWQVTIVVLVGVFVASLDLFIVNIAFPAIEKDFSGTSLAGLSWILNAYAIVFAALLVPAGRWADRAGRRKGFLGGLALFVLASAACALAPSVPVLVGARTIQAVGAAFMLPTSLGLLLPEFPPEKRAAAIGLWAATGGVAAACGPVVGGLLVGLSWRWVFLVNLPIGAAALFAGFRVLTERREESGPKPDALGAGLLAGAIGSLTLGIVKAPDWGWGSGRVLGLFALAAALLIALVVRSRSHPAPVVEPLFFKSRSVVLANVAAIIFFCGFASMLLGGVLYLTGVQGHSVLIAGLELAPGPFMAGAWAVPGGLLGARFGQRLIGAIGGLLFAFAGFWWHAHLGDGASYAADFLPGIIVSGVGVGFVLPTLSAAATIPLPPSRFATGSAVMAMSRQLGSALGVAVLIAILGTAAGSAGAFGGAWIFMSLAGVGAAIALASVGPVVADHEETPLEAATLAAEAVV